MNRTANAARAVLPRWVREQLQNCPTAGSGVNNWVFRTARSLQSYIGDPEIEYLLRMDASRCGRPLTDAEVQRAILRSKPNRSTSGGAHTKKIAWPKPNLEQINAIVSEGFGLADLWETSPVRFEEARPVTEEVIDTLLPGNPLLCVGTSACKFRTRQREVLRGALARMELMVPSPMSTLIGHTQDGKSSEHSLDNTGPRRFLVIECDFSTLARDNKTETIFAPLVRRIAKEGRSVADMCAAILHHLAQRAPMAIVVDSAGKSLHGWFFCAGKTDQFLSNFMRYAVSLGADKATWTRSQFVRVPDGLRQGKRRQYIHFFNPSVIK